MLMVVAVGFFFFNGGGWIFLFIVVVGFLCLWWWLGFCFGFHSVCFVLNWNFSAFFMISMVCNVGLVFI